MYENVLTSFSQTESGAFQLDISEVLDLVRAKDIALMGQISIGGEATAKQHSWLKDEMRGEEVTATADAAGALVPGEATFTVLSGHADRLRVGSIIMDKAVGLGEKLMVTNISDPTITVVVWPAGTNAAQTHAQSAKFLIVGAPIKEMAAPTDESATTRALKSNYIQLFERGISLSDETKNLKMRAVPNEESYQIEKKTWSVKRELGVTVLYGVQHSPGTVDDYGTMGGILEFLDVADANRIQASANLSEKDVNDLAQKILDKGGQPDIIVVGTDQSRKFATFDRARIRTVPSSTITGHFVDTYQTDTGLRLPIIVEPKLVTEYLLMLTKKDIKITPFHNEAWSVYTWPRTKYATQTTVKGAYTMEVRNAYENHGIVTGLTVPEDL